MKVKREDALRRMGFRRIGGSYQLTIGSAHDLSGVLLLDEALWAMTSVDIDALHFDRKFLEFLDDDRNQRIRADEVKRGIRWLLDVLKQTEGIDRRSDELRIDAINADHPEGALILAAARQVLGNLNLADAEVITLAQVNDSAGIIACARQNGDGVIPPEVTEDSAVAALIRGAIAALGGVPDISGADGIDAGRLDDYLSAVKNILEWRGEAARNPALLPWGEHTAALAERLDALSARLDDYFLGCAALRFCADAPARLNQNPGGADGLDAEQVKSFLARSLAAEPTPEAVLDFSGRLNPLAADELKAFQQALEDATGTAHPALACADWRALKNAAAAYLEWRKRKPTAAFDARSDAELEAEIAEETVARLREYLANDLAAQERIRHCDLLRKLILFQQNILNFLNNYVNLSELFNPKTTSALQAGKLVMDGRHFTLATGVRNVAEHKGIAQTSDICVVYLSIASGVPTALQTRTLAVAVTSGHMRNLFVGKGGVFFTPDGVAWDAKVIDFIQQPVSFSEALTMPFLRFGSFIGKQADKFFSSQSTEAQKALETNFATNAAQLTAAPGQPAKPQPPAVAGSMLLMGGGIGIAAIGSSIALIAQALHDISVWTVFSVFLGVILVFGGPVVAVSMVKLYRRNVARLLEAGNCAVNRRMRLTRRMGVIFTFTPPLPRRSLLISTDLVNLFSPRRNSSGKIWLRLLLTLLALAVVAAAVTRHYRVWPWPSPPVRSEAPAHPEPVPPVSGAVAEAATPAE